MGRDHSTRGALSRRSFFRSLTAAGAGIAIGSRLNGKADLSALQATSGARRRATLNGRRLTVVDVHAHCFVPEVVELIKGTPALMEYAKTNMSGAMVLGSGTPERLAYMDREGIDYQAINVNAWAYSAD